MNLINICDYVDEEIKKKFGEDNSYYSPKKLLAQKMDNGEYPVCYISTTNRTAGKTSYLALLSYWMFKLEEKQICYIVRTTAELNSYDETYGDMAAIYGWKETITTKVLVKDSLSAILIDGKTMGYVLTLKKYIMLKKYSPIFKDVELIAEDEYQLEDGRYYKLEMEAFSSIYHTISRGGGSQTRDVKILLMGNPVTLMNPYLIEFGISEKYNYGKEFIKSGMTVAQFLLHDKSIEIIKKSKAVNLFQDSAKYVCGEEFLIKDSTYLEKCKGKSDYLFTLVYGKNFFGVRQYKDTACVHVGRRHDPSVKKVLSFRECDRGQNIDMLERYDYTWNYIRNAYKYGKLRFDNLEAKTIIFRIIGIDIYS